MMPTRKDKQTHRAVGKKADVARSKQSPELFYRKITKRSDVREIMEKLAKL